MADQGCLEGAAQVEGFFTLSASRSFSFRARGGSTKLTRCQASSVPHPEIECPIMPSYTDPDSTYATKGGTPARLGYYDNYLVDNHSCVIVGVQATAALMSQETVAAQDMLTRFTQWQGREPESVAADRTYGNGALLQWLADRSITPYMRTRDSIHRKRSPFFGPERFTYEPENNRYICPAGQALNYGGWVHRNRAYNYIGTRKKCGPGSLRPQCN